MALKKCKECGEQISSKAEKCPHCGNPQSKKSSSLSVIIVLLGIGAFIYYCVDTGKEPLDVLNGLWTNIENEISEKDSEEKIKNDILKYKDIEVAYQSGMGPTVAGITLGEWLEKVSNVHGRTAITKITENDAKITVKLALKSPIKIFFLRYGNNTCIINEVTVNGKSTESSIEALQAMMILAP